MNLLPVSLPSAWSAQKQSACYYLAIGYTWQATADRSGVKSLDSIGRWLRESEFREVRDKLRSIGLGQLQQSYLRNVEMAFDVQNRVLAGDVQRDDGSATEAREVIGRFLNAALISRTGLAGDADGSPGLLAEPEAP